MNLLFLRGQVPSDRPKEQITFSTLPENDDMWTQLAYQLVVGSDGYGEVWYEKGKRETPYVRGKFIERWVPRYKSTTCSFKPDVVFARGGFKYMLEEIWRHPHAFKIHYGAGERIIPKAGQPWDLVLVDTPKQLAEVKARGYEADMFIKPAADNIFYPQSNGEPYKYDVILVANFNPNTNKGQRYLLPALKGYKVLSVGVYRPGWKKKYPNTKFLGWVPRVELPALYGQSKIAIVRAPQKDSCPRVIPEALACDCPVLACERTKFWHSKYITPETGRMFSKDNFQEVIADMIQNHTKFSPRYYYGKELSLGASAFRLLTQIETGMNKRSHK